MTFSNGGFEQDNESTSTVWAEHINHLTITQRGYYVVDIDSNKAKVSAQSSENLTVQVTSGDVFVGGTKHTVSSASHSLSTEHSALTSDQSRYVFVAVNSSGSLVNVAGTAGATASIKPPAYPNDKTVLAMIILTQTDTEINDSDIQDWRMEAPQGAYLNGAVETSSTLTTGGAITAGGDIDLNGNSLTDFGAIEFYTFTNTSVAASDDIVSGTITGTSYTNSSIITITADSDKKIKLKSGAVGNIDVTDNNYTPASYTDPDFKLEFQLQINNGSGWQDYSAVSSYTISSGTPTFNGLTLNSNVSTYNNSNALGADIQIKVRARANKALSVGTDIDYNYDLTTAISYALATKVGDYYSFSRI